MINKDNTSQSMVFSVVIGDLFLMNVLFAGLYIVWPSFNAGNIFSGSYWEMMAFNTLCYAVSTYNNGVVLHHRKKRNLYIIKKVTVNCLKFASISVAFIALAGYDAISTRFFVLFHVCNYMMLIIINTPNNQHHIIPCLQLYDVDYLAYL